MYLTRIPRKEREKGAEASESIMTENFPQINVRHQPQIEDTLKTASMINEKQTNKNRRRIIFSYRKSKIRKNSRTKPEEDNTLPREEQREELHPTSPQKTCKQEESRVRYLTC